MSKYHKCHECGETDNIVTIHDTLYICDECDNTFDPTQFYRNAE